jgi:hypothetical protein
MYLSSGDHGRYPAMEKAIHPAKLVLAGRPVTEDGVNMTVDQTR